MTATNQVPTASLPPQADHLSQLRANVPAIMSVDEGAKVTTLSRRTIAALLAAGKLKSFRVGRRRLIRKTDLEAFLGATL